MAKRRKSKLSHFSAGWEWAKANPLEANRYDSPEAKRRMQLGVELGSQALRWFSDGVDAWRAIAVANLQADARLLHRRELYIRSSAGT